MIPLSTNDVSTVRDAVLVALLVVVRVALLPHPDTSSRPEKSFVDIGQSAPCVVEMKLRMLKQIDPGSDSQGVR